jgi:predicted RND superfamily exporter protein
MWRASQQFILVPLLQAFNNSSVSSAVPYLCLLFSTFNAYAEIGLLVLMYRVCSLCLVVIYLPDCPTYELLQVLYLSL